MPRHSISLFIFIFQAFAVYGSVDSLRVHADLPTIDKHKKMSMDIFYSADTFVKADLILTLYKYDSETDSTLVFSRNLPKFQFKKGVNKVKTSFRKRDDDIFYERKFHEILKRAGSIAPGKYRTYINVKQNAESLTSVYLHEIDSFLSPGSPLRKDINNSVLPRKKSFLHRKSDRVSNKAKSTHAGVVFARAGKKANKAMRKRGFTSVSSQGKDVSYIDLYYQDWFAGRYELKNNESLAGQIEKIEDKGNVDDFSPEGLGNVSLFSQHKMINGGKKEDEDMTGSISFATNGGSAQEPNSGVDNNYSEIRGTTELPVMGIPVELEGLYTTQDRGRVIKSSYFRVHYDVQKVKGRLSKSISSYNSRFAAQKSQAGATNKLYDAAIEKLQVQKEKAMEELDEQDREEMAKMLAKEATDTTGLISEAERSTDTSEVKRRKRIRRVHKNVTEIDKKIRKYNVLREQYNNTRYFDSCIGFAKTRSVGEYDNMSYKQMAKMGVNILPDGKAKQFVSGITTVDAGMFTKSGSKYTMDGQMMKGASFGYDFGFCETNVTAGKTQYVGRNGNLDKYTCYSAKSTFKASKNGKISLVYYGYSADRNLYSGDVFFDKVNISAPGFFDPVHIVSSNYSGSLSKFVIVEGETAMSYRNSDRTLDPRMPGREKMACHFSADGNIPETYVGIGVAYDRVGKGFENQTLPLSMVGTEQYKISARDEFFRSLLSVGVEFNKLVHNNFASVATNTKWGFDVKTGFRKYPNVSVSYKPYTTFQSPTDTFAIPQRPIFGSVWSGKASYNIKSRAGSWRFSTLYSSCMTSMDTARYGNNTMQVSCVYAAKRIFNTLNVGFMEVTGTSAPSLQTTSGKSKFISLSTTYTLNKTLSFTTGEEAGLAPFGVCRYSITGGVVYRPQKAPYMVRFTARCTSYKLDEIDPWSRIYSGNIDITYRFKSHIKR